ncbi:MAG: DUF72 domain-containing protein [Promethearchaeati archaeon]
MVELKIGCAGWSYDDWIETFYPKHLNRSDHLNFYSKYFNLVEINATFYNLSSKEMVFNWNNRVPEDFRFAVKVWKEITHKYEQEDLNYVIYQFFEQLRPLNDKVDYYLLQFPPWFKYSDKHVEYLRKIIDLLPSNNKYVIELRDNSWFDENIIKILTKKSNIIIATSYIEEIIPYYAPNQNSYYIRLIGDRQIQSFKIVQRKKEEEITQLINKIQELKANKNVKEIFIIVNNHYTGFAPETANELKKKLGHPYHQFSKQKSLSDFI